MNIFDGLKSETSSGFSLLSSDSSLSEAILSSNYKFSVIFIHCQPWGWTTLRFNLSAFDRLMDKANYSIPLKNTQEIHPVSMLKYFVSCCQRKQFRVSPLRNKNGKINEENLLIMQKISLSS